MRTHNGADSKIGDPGTIVVRIVDADILEQASVDRCDALIATTGDDAQNLMAMVLAREAKVPATSNRNGDPATSNRRTGRPLTGSTSLVRSGSGGPTKSSSTRTPIDDETAAAPAREPRRATATTSTSSHCSTGSTRPTMRSPVRRDASSLSACHPGMLALPGIQMPSTSARHFAPLA